MQVTRCIPACTSVVASKTASSSETACCASCSIACLPIEAPTAQTLNPELTVAVCMLQCLPDKNLRCLHGYRPTYGAQAEIICQALSGESSCATVSLLHNAICIGTNQMLLKMLLGMSSGGTGALAVNTGVFCSD